MRTRYVVITWPERFTSFRIFFSPYLVSYFTWIRIIIVDWQFWSRDWGRRNFFDWNNDFYVLVYVETYRHGRFEKIEKLRFFSWEMSSIKFPKIWNTRFHGSIDECEHTNQLDTTTRTTCLTEKFPKHQNTFLSHTTANRDGKLV